MGQAPPESWAAATGAVVLDVACFVEAERLYATLKDTAVRGRLLTALVLPDLLVSEWPSRLFTHPRGGQREAGSAGAQSPQPDPLFVSAVSSSSSLGARRCHPFVPHNSRRTLASFTPLIQGPEVRGSALIRGCPVGDTSSVGPDGARPSFRATPEASTQ
ncbi:hypothetical protein P7K49_005799 [Saguinus oedipus]|uniref:Diacylglycerol kinase theta RNA-binding domain-containing protein n=1 Tax=Saguinus oedipus TaxID=9490 RepID=A0ABQ9W0J9_SAGOE|nr:hypothetical protein P7K49_005799 [Saguinus oedipus]